MTPFVFTVLCCSVWLFVTYALGAFLYLANSRDNYKKPLREFFYYTCCVQCISAGLLLAIALLAFITPKH